MKILASGPPEWSKFTLMLAKEAFMIVHVGLIDPVSASSIL